MYMYMCMYTCTLYRVLSGLNFLGGETKTQEGAVGCLGFAVQWGGWERGMCPCGLGVNLVYMQGFICIEPSSAGCVPHPPPQKKSLKFNENSWILLLRKLFRHTVISVNLAFHGIEAIRQAASISGTCYRSLSWSRCHLRTLQVLVDYQTALHGLPS